ncbi:hypothetical protein [Yoonia sp. BS5-3]|uniref:Uncharacterized protein n=1 Tax=Yoonia phaeophyticola TaxID=3137369 RepID=A0ABZ2V7H1_9RHOB
MIAYYAVIAASAGLTFALVNHAGDALVGPMWRDIGIVSLGCLMTVCGLFLCRNWMGGPGALGVARACVGAVNITFCVSIVAGTMVSPFFGLVKGPQLLMSLFGSEPIFAVLWGLILFETHQFLKRSRLEMSPTKTADLRQGNVSDFTLKNVR